MLEFSTKFFEMKLNQEFILKQVPSKYIKRDLELLVLKDIKLPEVVIIYGARQVGKSTMVFSMASELMKLHPVYYFSLDDYKNEDFRSIDRLLSRISADLNNQPVVILDEAQRIKDIGLLIKQIYDQKLGIKFILTGSSSFTIKSETRESLVGRKFEYHLYPLSMAEILRYEGFDPIQLRAANSKLDKLLQDYLIYGGYPQIYFTEDIEVKKRRLIEIADTYIIKDLSALFGIEDTNAVRKVATYVGENIGNLLSIDKITSLGGLKRDLVVDILEALDQLFISYQLYPFSNNKFAEVTKSPKIYFHDVGIRNAFLRKLDDYLLVNDQGSLFENYVGNQLVYQNGVANVSYWRNINQTEVDFIARVGSQRIAIESKLVWEYEQMPSSLRSFIGKYSTEGKVITKSNFWDIVNYQSK